MKLEQSAGISMLSKREERIGIEYSWECCQSKNTFTPGVNSLKDWLALIKLERYQKLFEQSGYEDLQFVISLMNSRYPIDDVLLVKIGVNKLGHRMRILAKLLEDAQLASGRSANTKETCNLL